MSYKKIFLTLLAVIALGILFINTASAKVSRNSASVKDFEDVPQSAIKRQTEECLFTVPEEKKYEAQVVAIRRKLRVEIGEIFRVKVFLKNTGTMPWFSNKSQCLGPKMSLGTDKPRDRASVLFADKIEGIEATNWEGPNRIGMDQLRINPGEIASFTFWSSALQKADVLKEYFAPVLKNIQWVDNALFPIELVVGDTGDTPLALKKKMLFANASGSVADINLRGEKMIKLDLSEQKLWLLLDGKTVREFRVSTGASKTPTPVGETKILIKQEVRIAHKSPHYVMPKYMMYRSGGFGFHALPSLAHDGGIFWTEARNHIGRPVSHGCVRLLPEDADFMYEFTDIGTKVVIER